MLRAGIAFGSLLFGQLAACVSPNSSPAPRLTSAPAESAPLSAPAKLFLSPTPSGAGAAAVSAAADTPLTPSAAQAVSVPAASRRTYVVAVMGDSLTDYRGGSGGYVRELAKLCPESQFDNYGIGGQMVNQMRRRFERDVLGLDKPRYTDVIIFGGVNDIHSNLTAHRTNERIQADLTQMYNWAHARGIRTIALTVAPWGGFHRYYDSERAENTRALNRWLLASQGSLLDLALETAPLLSCGNPEELCKTFVAPFNDGLHFGKDGHRILGQALQARAFADCR